MANADKIVTPVKGHTEGDLINRDVLAERVEHARESAEGLYRRSRDRAVQFEREFEGYVAGHPLKSVLIAAGIGAGVGLVLGVLLARR